MLVRLNVNRGFRTPGSEVAVADLPRRDPHPSDETISEALSGNLRGCTWYQKILDPADVAADRMGEASR